MIALNPGRISLGAAVGLTILALGACIPEPPDNDEIIDYRRDSPMGLIQEAGVLRVGIERWPPFSEAGGGAETGFLVDYGRDIAAALGVEAQFEVATAERLADQVKGEEPDLDIVFPMRPVTEPVARANAITDPYWVGHQRMLLTEPDPNVARTARTCLIEGHGVIDTDGMGAAEVGVQDVFGDADAESLFETVSAGTKEHCAGRLPRSAEAATGPDVALLWLLARGHIGEIAGDQLTTEGYSGFVRNDLPGLADFVNTQLAEAKAEGRWEAWYERWIAPHLDEPLPAPPDMTAEEAAALYPAELE